MSLYGKVRYEVLVNKSNQLRNIIKKGALACEALVDFHEMTLLAYRMIRVAILFCDIFLKIINLDKSWSCSSCYGSSIILPDEAGQLKETSHPYGDTTLHSQSF